MVRAAKLLSLLVLLTASGCATFDPEPLETVPFRENAQTESHDGVTVSVAVLNEQETRKAFDVPMQREKIQPVWVRIQNDTDETFFFLTVGLDPDYFSPYETSWKNHFFMGGQSNDKMDDYMYHNQLDLLVGPRSIAEGFTYTNRDADVKLVSVNLLGDDQLLEFDFIIEITGFKADYLEVDFDSLYSKDQLRDVTLDDLRREVAALPCCVLGGDNKTDGDPLNLVVVGNMEELIAAFVQRGWHLTETLHSGSVWNTIKSSIFGTEYRNSPISPLYLYDRSQDIGLQKTRETVDERNHLRLWLAPFRYDDKQVWVGQISRDIGVRFSSKTFITHEIDPEVDEARDYVVQDLMLSQEVDTVAFVDGVGQAHKDEPRYNYTESPYFTDGLRAIIFVAGETVALDEIDILDWGFPPQDFE